MEALHSRNAASVSYTSIVKHSTGFYAICAYRLANSLITTSKEGSNTYLEAFKISSEALRHVGIDIDPRARIGNRFSIDHGYGIVIGETSTIGNNCYFLGGVVLGGKAIADSKDIKRHPDIGNNVEIGMNARIFGPIKVGDNTFISPHAVITEDVPSDSRVIIVNQLQVLNQVGN